jgi:molecular chaperone GrpE
MMGEEQKQEKEDQEVKLLARALIEEKKRSEEYLARLKYAQADIENVKKRCERQIEEIKKYSNERFIKELLEVVDELELAVKSGNSANSADTLIQGVKMTLKKLRKLLESEEVSPIECVGKPFDPAKHDAVARIERDDVEECMVIEEVRKG